MAGLLYGWAILWSSSLDDFEPLLFALISNIETVPLVIDNYARHSRTFVSISDRLLMGRVWTKRGLSLHRRQIILAYKLWPMLERYIILYLSVCKEVSLILQRLRIKMSILPSWNRLFNRSFSLAILILLVRLHNYNRARSRWLFLFVGEFTNAACCWTCFADLPRYFVWFTQKDFIWTFIEFCFDCRHKYRIRLLLHNWSLLCLTAILVLFLNH